MSRDKLVEERALATKKLRMWLDETPVYLGDDPRAAHYRENRECLETALAALAQPLPVGERASVEAMREACAVGEKMAEFNVEHHKGVAFVLPKFETLGVMRRIGRFAVFIDLAWDRFGIGFQILEAGALAQIGPVYFGACHIEKQTIAFERLEALASKSDALAPPPAEG